MIDLLQVGENPFSAINTIYLIPVLLIALSSTAQATIILNYKDMVNFLMPKSETLKTHFRKSLVCFSDVLSGSKVPGASASFRKASILLLSSWKT